MLYRKLYWLTEHNKKIKMTIINIKQAQGMAHSYIQHQPILEHRREQKDVCRRWGHLRSF